MRKIIILRQFLHKWDTPKPPKPILLLGTMQKKLSKCGVSHIHCSLENNQNKEKKKKRSHHTKGHVMEMVSLASLTVNSYHVQRHSITCKHWRHSFFVFHQIYQYAILDAPTNMFIFLDRRKQHVIYTWWHQYIIKWALPWNKVEYITAWHFSIQFNFFRGTKNSGSRKIKESQ